MAKLTTAEELANALAALAQAQRANAAKSRFLAAASHDLRQPLQALRLLNAALREYLTADDVALNILQDSERSLEVMDQLLGSLLDISKIDSGVIAPDERHFKISDLLDGLRGDFLRLAKEKDIELIIVPSSRVIYSDPVMLNSILRNFLANAVRYTTRGKILVGCRPAGPSLRIEVWDTGIGIPPGQLSNIFDEFYQIGAPGRDRNQGLGLGLSIVRGYARLLRHPLGVRSQPGAGSVFSVEAPLGNPDMADKPGQEQEAAAAGWNLQGCRVLLIEDDPRALEAMETLLSLWGMRITGARSGPEAVEIMVRDNFAPEIVITDYRLADGETGIDAIRRIEPLTGKDVPVIFVTGDAIAEVRAALGGRFPYLLQKPVAPGKLRVLIRNLRRRASSG